MVFTEPYFQISNNKNISNMRYLREIREKTRILNIFVRDSEVRLGKNHTAILSFSCSIEWCRFH